MNLEHHSIEVEEEVIGATLETGGEVTLETGGEVEQGVGLQMGHLQESNMFSYVIAVTPKVTEQKNAQ